MSNFDVIDASHKWVLEIESMKLPHACCRCLSKSVSSFSSQRSAGEHFWLQKPKCTSMRLMAVVAFVLLADRMMMRLKYCTLCLAFLRVLQLYARSVLHRCTLLNRADSFSAVAALRSFLLVMAIPILFQSRSNIWGHWGHVARPIF